MQKDKIITFIAQAITLGIVSGLTYKEGKIAAEVMAEIMDQVDKTPNANDNDLAWWAEKLLEAKLVR